MDKRYSKWRVCVVIALLCAGLLLPHAATAQGAESISEFLSEIVINRDASLSVRETITLQLNAANQENGMYRYYPTEYPLGGGARRTVRYDEFQVMYNGASAPFQVLPKTHGVLLQIGNNYSQLPGGSYTFVITYRTTGQIDYFADHDKLYWHVTGSNWQQPITGASAVVAFPLDVQAAQIHASGFTTHHGVQLALDSATVDAKGHALFATPNRLMPGDGMTVLVEFPKGVVAQPSAAEERASFYQDNFTLYSGLAAFVIVLLLYLLMWAFVGRDPAPGVLRPRTTPPDRLSPALTRYIRQMRYDPKILASVLISLARKGILTITELEDRYRLHRVAENDTETLKDQLIRLRRVPERAPSLEEEVVANILLMHGGAFEFSYHHAEQISAAIHALTELLRDRCERIYFSTNRLYLAMGMGASLLWMMMLGYREVPDGFPEARIGMMLGILVLGVSLTLLPIIIWHYWHDIFSHHVGRIGNTGLMFKYALLVFAPLLVGAWLMWDASAPLWWLLFAMTLLHLLFAYLLKAPTMQGRALLDQIDGFRLYLSGDHPAMVQLVNPPAKTQELFEQYLPFAMALDEERNGRPSSASCFADSRRQRSPGMRDRHGMATTRRNSRSRWMKSWPVP